MIPRPVADFTASCDGETYKKEIRFACLCAYKGRGLTRHISAWGEGDDEDDSNTTRIEGLNTSRLGRQRSLPIEGVPDSVEDPAHSVIQSGSHVWSISPYLG